MVVHHDDQTKMLVHRKFTDDFDYVPQSNNYLYFTSTCRVDGHDWYEFWAAFAGQSEFGSNSGEFVMACVWNDSPLYDVYLYYRSLGGGLIRVYQVK